MEDELVQCLSTGACQKDAAAALDGIIERHGAVAVAQWAESTGRERNQVAHLLAASGWCDVLEHVVRQHGFNMDAQRASDMSTPAHVAVLHGKEAVVWRLWDLGANTQLRNLQGVSADDLWRTQREKMNNLVFLDLEYTAGFYDKPRVQPEILEVAIVVTDKWLRELGRGQWVVGGFTEGFLKSLADFHQKHFRDTTPGGHFPPLKGSEDSCNGLFSDVLASMWTKEKVEEAMLDLVQAHCPEHGCPLVGYSIHCDREVLMVQMPKFYSYMSHQIVDISSFLRMGSVWLPQKMKSRRKGGSKYNHRAMNDVEDSIETLHWVRSNLFQRRPPRREESSDLAVHKPLSSRLSPAAVMAGLAAWVRAALRRQPGRSLAVGVLLAVLADMLRRVARGKSF